MDQTRVAIGIPHLGNLPGYFFDSVVFLEREGIDVNTVRVQDRPIDLARNAIAKVFAESEFTHLFFMDADMHFHKATLKRLLAHDLPVVSGTYFARTDTPVPHVYRYNRTDEKGVWYDALAGEFAEWMKRHPEEHMLPNAWCFPPSDDSLIECDALGAGCLLIKREVFEAIEYPYFVSEFSTGGAEDFDFCEKVRAAGFKLYADFAVQANHETRMSFIGREEFSACFSIGTEDETDFTQPVPIEIRPSGQRIIRPRRALSPTGFA